MDYILQCISIFLPTILSLILEVGVVKWAISCLKQIKETKEIKEVISQNKILLEELRKAKEFNSELLTKIDKIQRGEN